MFAFLQIACIASYQFSFFTQFRRLIAKLESVLNFSLVELPNGTTSTNIESISNNFEYQNFLVQISANQLENNLIMSETVCKHLSLESLLSSDSRTTGFSKWTRIKDGNIKAARFRKWFETVADHLAVNDWSCLVKLNLPSIV